MATADQFTYRAIRSEDDQEWIGLCDGFDAAMNWMAPDRQAALDGIRAIVGEFLDLLDERGLPHPSPTISGHLAPSPACCETTDAAAEATAT